MAFENKLAYAQKCSEELDKILVHKAKTGFMTQNDFGVSFTGADEVKVPDIELTGAGKYDKATGYPKSLITINRETYKLEQDRGVQFSIDAVDADQVGVEKLASQVLGEFVRTKMMPESDAYSISKLAGIASNKAQTIPFADYADAPYKAFVDMEGKIFETGNDENLIVLCSRDYYNSLVMSKEVEKVIDAGSFKHGDVTLDVKKINETYIVVVPEARLYTAYNFLEGATPDDFGFEPAEGANKIKMLMLPAKAASKINKHEVIRIVEPSDNDDADAYKFNYRLHYDVLVKKSMLPTIWAMIEETV